MGSIIYDYTIPELVPDKPHEPLTLTERNGFEQNELLAGITEGVCSVNRFFELFPFRDKQEGDHGEELLFKMDCNSTPEGILSGAKALGRGFMKTFAKTLEARCHPNKHWHTDNKPISVYLLDILLSQVEGDSVDFLMMPKSVIRQYFGIRRGLGGEALNEHYELTSGRTCPVYKGVPIIRNDFMVNENNSAILIAGRFENKNSDDKGLIGIHEPIAYNSVEGKDGLVLSWDTGIIIPDQTCFAVLDGVANE